MLCRFLSADNRIYFSSGVSQRFSHVDDGRNMTKNLEIAQIFTAMADILEIKNDNIFKIRAYRRAAVNIEGLAAGIEELSRKELLEIPGIGAALVNKIEEYLQTGSVHALDKLKGEIPHGLLELLKVPGLGPKAARILHEQFHITTLEELEQAARENRLAGFAGIEKKNEETFMKWIATVKKENDLNC